MLLMYETNIHMLDMLYTLSGRSHKLNAIAMAEFEPLFLDIGSVKSLVNFLTSNNHGSFDLNNFLGLLN